MSAWYARRAMIRYERKRTVCLIPGGGVRRRVCIGRGRCDRVVVLGIVLLLGISTWAGGQSPEPAATRPAPSPEQHVTLAPSEASRGPSASTPESLDKSLRLITGNNESDVRLMGARELLRAGVRAEGGEEAAKRLISVLAANPSDLAAQVAVCRAIADFDGPMPSLVESLLSLLGDRRPGLDEHVSRALRRFDNGLVIERLRDLAGTGNGDLEKREAAIGALGEMGDNLKAVDAIVTLVADKTARIRLAALSALSQATGVQHGDAASAAAWWDRHKTMTRLDWLRVVNEHRGGQIRDLRDRTKRLTSRLVASYRESYVRTMEAERPGKLRVFLGDELPEVRALGLELINVLITDRKEVNQEIKHRLVGMIVDADAGLRLRVAVMVGDLRLTDAVPELVDALARERDYSVRAAQVNAVGRLDGIAAIPALIGRLDDDASSVVVEAALALAAIGRRAQEEPETVQTVTTALMTRFGQITVQDEALREKFLDAMARIGTEPFRAVFKAELAADRGVRVRRAAVRGLGSYGDTAAANDVCPFVTSPEPEIRLDAVEALGRCGQRKEDLDALVGRLDGTNEADPAVRDRAWDSYVQIAERLPPKDVPAVSDVFARAGDPVAQRRRLELLKLLTGAPPKMKKLSVEEQGGVYARAAEAQMELGDVTASAVSLDKALGLAEDPTSGRYASLAARLVTALFGARQDEAVVQRLNSFCDIAVSNGASVDWTPIGQAVLAEVRARIDAASDAAACSEVIKLIESLSAPAARMPADFAQELKTARSEAIARREAAIDRLLGAIGTDAQAESKLLAFGKGLVLPRLHAKLAGMPTTTAPVEPGEGKLIALGRKLVDAWPGYEPGGPPGQRAKALEALKAAGTSPQTEPVTTAPSPAPAP